MKNLQQKFTEKELEIIELAVEGLTNTEIAKELQTSVNTVKSHLLNIYDKFEIHNRIQLVILTMKSKYTIEQ